MTIKEKIKLYVFKVIPLSVLTLYLSFNFIPKVSAYIIDNQTSYEVIDTKGTNEKYATSTFGNYAEYEKTIREDKNKEEILMKLDLILVELRGIRRDK